MNNLRLTIFLTGLLGTATCLGQGLLSGRVLDSQKGFPLISATVHIPGRGIGIYTDHEGRFTLDLTGAAPTDTLVITYIGYTPFRALLPAAGRDSLFRLKEAATVLKEIIVPARTPERPDLKKLESSLRVIRGKLYAANIEVTNREYNRFLRYLQQTGDEARYRQYKPDISMHESSLLAFFKAYHATGNGKSVSSEYDNYPVVNITHEAAVAYCTWLTQQYHEAKGKRKFKYVVFRLPTLKEWQITALGYPKFQSWTLDDNEIETFISNDPNEMMGKTKVKKTIPFKGSDIRYPWFNAYDYRNKPQNHKRCWLGNFKVPERAESCLVYRPDGDGYAITGTCGSYFPNDMGFYDVVGNVAEMIDERGIACGGSWNHAPEDATITSVMQYKHSSMMVGFRVFMTVLE